MSQMPKKSQTNKYSDTGLHDKVKAKEQRLLNAQKAKLKDEELQELKDDLSQARVEEEKARATAI